MTENISIGDIVISLCGHDTGKRFVVIEKDKDYCYISDGKNRTLLKLKKKKSKHLLKDSQCCDTIKEKLLNKELLDAHIKKAIKSAENKERRLYV